jgi:hypothetical protein
MGADYKPSLTVGLLPRVHPEGSRDNKEQQKTSPPKKGWCY